MTVRTPTDRRIRGNHRCKPGAGTYDLSATPDGIVYCERCGARDLLPEAEAKQAAGTARDWEVRLDAFAERHRQSVLRGERSVVRIA